MRFGLDFLNADITISIRRFAAVALLLSSTLTWFYIFHAYLLEELLKSVEGDFIFIIGLGKLFFYSFAVIAGIIGSLISERVERRKFLGYWIAFGFLATVSLIFFKGLEISLLSTSLLGISFGLGFPTCQAFLTESTTFIERGRTAGIAFFLCFVSLIPLLLFASQIGIIGLILICAALIGTSSVALFIDPCQRKKGPVKPWLSILKNKTFASFAFPWLIFQLSNGISLFAELPNDVSAVATLGKALQAVATIFAVLISGFIADRVGRKQPILIGFLLLGVSYALMGIVFSPESYFFYLSVSGLAWGLIMVSYMQAVLGDLSFDTGSKERYFALGGIMIPLFTYTIFSVAQEWTNLRVPANWLTAILSVVLLASAIPVLRAKDPLIERKMQERRYKEYTSKVGKIAQDSKKH